MRFPAAYIFMFKWGQGNMEYFESDEEEKNRYKKKLGILRITKDDNDNNKEPT